jgi:hypothetical protein
VTTPPHLPQLPCQQRDPSILHFLVASGDDITSKQLRDDLMVGGPWHQRVNTAVKRRQTWPEHNQRSSASMTLVDRA